MRHAGVHPPPCSADCWQARWSPRSIHGSVFTNIASTRWITDPARNVLGVAFVFDEFTIKLHFVTLWRAEGTCIHIQPPAMEAGQGSISICIVEYCRRQNASRAINSPLWGPIATDVSLTSRIKKNNYHRWNNLLRERT